jgi:hypothetical protein
MTAQVTLLYKTLENGSKRAMEIKPEKRWYIQRLPLMIDATTPFPQRWTDLVMAFSTPKDRRPAERTYRSKRGAVAALRDECNAKKGRAVQRLSSADKATTKGRVSAAVCRLEITYYNACLRALSADE